MEIKKLEDSGNWIFRDFFANNDFVLKNLDWIYNSWSPRSATKVSEKSFCFGDWSVEAEKAGDRTEWVFKILQQVFGLDDSLKCHLRQATHGGGNEWRRINQLNSSSLLAFLTFGCRTKPLMLTLGDGHSEEFPSVYLEVKNQFRPMRSRKTPASSIDIVLVNETSAVFLESKFTEYVDHCTSSESLSYDQYRNVYDKIWPDKHFEIGGVAGRITRDGDKLVLRSQKGAHYLQGVKQMISHCVGLAGEIGVNCGRLSDRVVGRKKYLGEIVFDFQDCINNSRAREKCMSCLKEYHDMHSGLVEVLQPLVERTDGVLGSATTLIPKLLTYQDVMSGCGLKDTVADFYKLKS